MEKNLRYIRKAKQFKVKKRLGQNFLIDEEIIDEIINTASVSSDETIIEIGAGLGFVTEKLAQKAKNVIAIELDDDMVFELEKLPFSNIEVLQKDILKTDFSDLTNKPVKVTANIPYYITSPIIAHLIGEIDQCNNNNREYIKEIILMVQYEVAKRLVANEQSPAKEYGLLSILVNYWCKSEFICKVPADSFYPVPKVDSAIVKLSVLKQPSVKLHTPAVFKKIIQAAFGMRRKTIKNALVKNSFDANKVDFALEKAVINPQKRGETLSIEDFNRLTFYFKE